MPIQIEHLKSVAQNSDLVGQNVTISGWGEDENNDYPQYLMKQEVSIEAFKHRTIKLKHPAGHGACSGDSGGTDNENNHNYPILYEY